MPHICGRRALARIEQKERTMANITRYDPFSDLVDDIFRGFVVGPVGFEAASPVRCMKVDVAEQNGEYKVVAELPGVKKEDIKVNIDGDQVSITAESRAERDEKDGERLLHSDRYLGKVSRAFLLSQEIDEARASAKFAHDVALLKLVGMNPVIVHSGGPQIDEQLARMGKKGEFVQGMRVTDAETMDVVEMVLGGQVNKEVVTLINQAGGKAVGLTGQDGAFVRARKLLLFDKNNGGEKIDIGQVGEIASIDPQMIWALEESGFIPVVAA